MILPYFNVPVPSIHATNLDDHVLGTGFGERIYLGAGGDMVEARGGADQAFGGDGNDFLHGEAGNDSLFGERGDDLLNGGDRFVIGNFAGRDTVADFDPDAPLEVIDLKAFGFASFREVMRGAEDVHGGVVLHLDADSDLFIGRWRQADLEADWFSLA